MLAEPPLISRPLPPIVSKLSPDRSMVPVAFVRAIPFPLMLLNEMFWTEAPLMPLPTMASPVTLLMAKPAIRLPEPSVTAGPPTLDDRRCPRPRRPHRGLAGQAFRNPWTAMLAPAPSPISCWPLARVICSFSTDPERTKRRLAPGKPGLGLRDAPERIGHGSGAAGPGRAVDLADDVGVAVGVAGDDAGLKSTVRSTITL